MTTLSLAMIVKNEAETLERILTCAKGFCDELVVVDTGSTDKTVKIAEKAGAKVFHFAWTDNFAEARNYAFDCTSGDWIIWLDADDFVPESEQAKIREIKQALSQRPDIDVVCMTYQYTINDANECEFSFYRERILRRSVGYRWECPVHECIAFDYQRTWMREDVNIEHRPKKTKVRGERNIRILKKAYEAGDRSDRVLFYYGNELKDHQKFAEAIPFYNEYLENAPDNWEKYTAFLHLGECYKQTDGHDMDALFTFQRAMVFNSERAEAFNQIGIYYYEKEQWRHAIPYFAAATEIPRPENQGFIYDAHYTWLPLYYLAFCHYHLKQPEKALFFAQQTLKTHPDKQQVLQTVHWILNELAERKPA